MTTVLIVDDLGSIREFLKVNLSSEPDIQIVGLADNGERAIVQIEEHQPNVVLMDIDMPGRIDGIQATAKIAKRFPQTKVLLLTSQDDSLQLNRALKSGSRGYILKNTSIKDIANIIRLTEKGFVQIGPIFGDWDGSLHHQVHSQVTALEANQNGDRLEAMAPQLSYSPQSSEVPEVKHALSDLTFGIFQLQETIKSQEETIIDLNDKYSQIKQEIKTRSSRRRSSANAYKVIAGYGLRTGSVVHNQQRQHILFICSFLLGMLTVVVLMVLIMMLG